jgi:hypothetical protein
MIFLYKLTLVRQFISLLSFAACTHRYGVRNLIGFVGKEEIANRV